MQSHAKANGIIVGEYVKNKILLNDDLFSLVADSDGKVTRRYIFEDRKNGFLYTQYEFNWSKYLKSLPYLREEQDGLVPYTKEDAEKDRLNKLRQTAGLIGTGNAFTDSLGNISYASTGVKNQPHRFHYEE